MTQLAFAAKRRAGVAAIDQYHFPARLAHSSKPEPPQRHAVDDRWERQSSRETERRTDNLPLHRGVKLPAMLSLKLHQLLQFCRVGSGLAV